MTAPAVSFSLETTAAPASGADAAVESKLNLLLKQQGKPARRGAAY